MQIIYQMESSTKSKSGEDNLCVGRNPQRFALCLSHSPWGHSPLTHMHAYALMYASYHPPPTPPPSEGRGRTLSSSVLLIDEAGAEGCLGEAGPDQGCELPHHVRTSASVAARGFCCLCRVLDGHSRAHGMPPSRADTYTDGRM